MLSSEEYTHSERKDKESYQHDTSLSSNYWQGTRFISIFTLLQYISIFTLLHCSDNRTSRCVSSSSPCTSQHNAIIMPVCSKKFEKYNGTSTVADLEFHEGGFVRSGALACPRKFLKTTPTSGQKPRPLRS